MRLQVQPMVKATVGARKQALFPTPKLQSFGLNSAVFASFPQVEPMAQDWPRSESMECCFPPQKIYIKIRGLAVSPHQLSCITPSIGLKPHVCYFGGGLYSIWLAFVEKFRRNSERQRRYRINSRRMQVAPWQRTPICLIFPKKLSSSKFSNMRGFKRVAWMSSATWNL